MAACFSAAYLCFLFFPPYLQAEEVTEELLTFHQALNKMQEMEEVLVDEYKAYLEVRRQTLSAFTWLYVLKYLQAWNITFIRICVCVGGCVCLSTTNSVFLKRQYK